MAKIKIPPVLRASVGGEREVDASGEIPLINTVRGAGFILSSRGAEHLV